MRQHPSFKEIIVFYFKAFFVFILVVLSAGFAIWYAERAEDENDKSTIAISGQAEREVTPDIVEISIGTFLEGNDPVQLQEDANTAINNAVDQIQALGIEEENIRTSNYNLSSDYYWEDDEDEYSIDVTIQVTIEDLSSQTNSNIVGDVLAQGAAAGLNQVRYLSYDISNKKEILEELELEAIDDAESKKDSYEDASGLKLGKLVDISFGGGYNYPRYGFDDFAAVSEAELGAPVIDTPIEIEVGQDTLQSNVTLYYEVK